MPFPVKIDLGTSGVTKRFAPTDDLEVDIALTRSSRGVDDQETILYERLARRSESEFPALVCEYPGNIENPVTVGISGPGEGGRCVADHRVD